MADVNESEARVPKTFRLGDSVETYKFDLDVERKLRSANELLARYDVTVNLFSRESGIR